MFLKLIDSDITFGIVGVDGKHNSKSVFTQEQMNYIVKSIKDNNDSILIALEESEKVETLEELGYSFEVGM